MAETTDRRALRVLKETFGYDGFRPHQAEVVAAALAGRDVLAVMPTSAGKSICYQVPALVLGGLTVVVSPLISLMADQVGSLRQLGVAAECLNSSLDAAARSEVMDAARSGSLTLLYVAPERLEDQAFLDVCAERGVALLAVDEAHCISQWGNDFRPSYQRIIEFIRALPKRPAVLALTATATAAVRRDIRGSLGLRDPLEVVASFDRPNLSFAVERPRSREEKDRALLSFLRERPQESGIVYCSSRHAVEEVCQTLCEQGILATRYHAGLSAGEREQNQGDFLYDRRRVMVATNAFGMGIDKSNVGFVVHYNLPLSLEGYYQEAGRAGRDGSHADCLLLYTPSDVHTAEFLISRTRRDDLTDAQLAELRAHDEERLRQMVFYATTSECLRAHILRYFGEEAPAYCGSCGNCLASFEEVDATTDALKVVSCVARMRQRGQSAGAAMIVDVLRGSRSERVLRRRFDQLSTYGIMTGVPARQIRSLLDELVYRGVLSRSAGEYPVIGLTAQSGAFLRREAPWDRPLTIKVAAETSRAQRPAGAAHGGAVPTAAHDLTTEDQALYQSLVDLRTELAREQQIPPYLVFTNATLLEMCVRRPHTIEELLEVSGVGARKAERYGRAFLGHIAAA